jgi:hypothetical protein
MMTTEATTRGQVWEVADMVIADGARWTVRRDADGWNLWRHRFDNPDGMRGGADLVRSFGEDRDAAVAAAHSQEWPAPYEAVRLGRRFVGIELKRSYWDVAAENLRRAEAIRGQDMFSSAERAGAMPQS